LPEAYLNQPNYDLKNIVTENRFIGLWRLLTGYRFVYVIAAISLGITALLRTGTYLLIRYLVDDIVVAKEQTELLPLVAVGFIGLAILQGGFTFLSGRLAALTSEELYSDSGITSSIIFNVFPSLIMMLPPLVNSFNDLLRI